jgi:dihydroxyacetone kinase-like predicted kinase
VDDVLFKSLEKIDVQSSEVITLYYGNDVDEQQAANVVNEINKTYPGKQVELVHGGQPHYDYIISLE